jgi:hypothetical protein
MAFREVRVFEVREALRCGWPGRASGRSSGWRFWTARRCAATSLPARRLGWSAMVGSGSCSDVLVGMVVEAVRPGSRSRWRSPE